jgi:hypothetical protein
VTRPRSVATGAPIGDSMPGKDHQSCARRTEDPLFLLDEVDKMSADFRGDPSSALLSARPRAEPHVQHDTTWSRLRHQCDVHYRRTRSIFRRR